MYVGASGAVMGLIGLYVTDILLNWESMTMPLLRLVAMLIAIGAMLALEYVVTPLTPAVRCVLAAPGWLFSPPPPPSCMSVMLLAPRGRAALVLLLLLLPARTAPLCALHPLCPPTCHKRAAM